MKYTDKNKREWFKMFLDGQPSSFCESVLCKLSMSDFHKSILFARYVFHKADKEIGNSYNPPLCKDYINREIGKALVEAYNSFKTLSLSVFEEE